MEEKIEYNQELRSESGTTWQALRKTSALSFDSHTSTYSSPQDHLLKYIPEKENHSQRPIIPATRLEKLSYFRCCVSTPTKNQIVCMQHVEFNRFLWNYILNVFFKSLPLTFVYIFLASYSPDEHFFVTKMAPICYGFNVAYVIAAVVDISACLKTIMLLLDYAICGLLFKNPWNRCHSTYFNDTYENVTINCYSLKKFIKKFENDTPYFNISSYVTTNGEHFQSAPVVYYGKRVVLLTSPMLFGTLKFVYYFFIWTFVCLHYKQLFKRYIWKMLNNLHIFVNGIYLFVFIHLALHYSQVESSKVAKVRSPYGIDLQNLLLIQPTRDSTVIIISNAIYCIFRGFISYRVKIYCESFIKSPIYFTIFNQDSFFYFWPIYFSTFFFGDFYSIIFFASHFLMELFTLIVTFQCLVEAIVCEWRLAKRVKVTIILLLVGLLWLWFSSLNVRMIFYIYTKSLVTLLEVIGIYVLYPMGRLIDDITFYSGVVPTKMRIINLRLFPLYYGVKLWTLFDTLFAIAYKTEPENNFIFDYLYASVCVISVPVVFGAMYSAYVYIRKKNKSWTSLFRPDDTWGPSFAVRELRKQYCSREFVGSQAPRMLSRYMIQKAESKVYHLDLRYDMYPSRRSTFVVDEKQPDIEKKNM